MTVRVQRIPVTMSPFNGLFDLEREIDDLFGGFLNVAPRVRQYPAIDLAEYESESVLVAEMPGVRKEDIKVSAHDGILTISGERKAQALPDKSSWVRNEIATGEFSRSIQLPHDVETGKISAEMQNGVLRIVLPKPEEVRPREIKIS